MLNTETLLFILRVGNINLYQTGGQLLEPSTVFEEFIRRSKGRLSLSPFALNVPPTRHALLVHTCFPLLFFRIQKLKHRILKSFVFFKTLFYFA
jgi:hypothetical protein